MEKKLASFLVALVVIAAFAVLVAYLGMNQLNPRSEGILGATINGKQSAGVIRIDKLSEQEQLQLQENYNIVAKGGIVAESVDGQQLTTQYYSLIPKSGGGVILRGSISCIVTNNCDEGGSVYGCAPPGCGFCYCSQSGGDYNDTGGSCGCRGGGVRILRGVG